jgi:hypothetical protein
MEKKEFFHIDIIKQINRDFPLLLMGDIKERYEFKGNITINKLLDSYYTGSGDDEQKISENMIRINGKDAVKLTYVENVASAELTIKIEGKPVGSIKRMGRINDEIIEALTLAVNENIKSRT